MNELQKLLSEQSDWIIISLTSGFIMGVLSLAALAWFWLFDKGDFPDYQDEEYDDYNDRTG